MVTNPCHLIGGENLKKAHKKMFSQTNYVEQDTARNHMALVKTNRVSKYTLSVQKYAIHNIRRFQYYPFIILVMSSKNELINLKPPKYLR